jgi:hypothetical protein
MWTYDGCHLAVEGGQANGNECLYYMQSCIETVCSSFNSWAADLSSFSPMPPGCRRKQYRGKAPGCVLLLGSALESNAVIIWRNTPHY